MNDHFFFVKVGIIYSQWSIEISFLKKTFFNVLKKCNIKKNDFLMKIENKKTKDRLRKLTKDAYMKDIFGAPTFVVNKKIFWGQDRLEYALDEFFKKN